jgi:hypothetical protein
MVFEASQAPYGPKDYEGDLEEARAKIEKKTGRKCSWGGSLRRHTGSFNFHMARRSAGDREEVTPLYAVAVIRFDVGIIVGSHKTATIANAIQKKLRAIPQGEMDGGVMCHSKSNGVDHVWFVGCSSAGVREVVAKKMQDYEFMLLPDELTGPADEMNRLQKTVAKFWELAEEKNGGGGFEARKAYKTAQKSISAKIDARLLEGFNIADVWEMATAEQAAERKNEWSAAKAIYTKNYTHGLKRRQALAQSIMLSPDEAGVWSDEMKEEANKHAISLRRILHHLLGEVVVVKDMGKAQAIPEDGPPAEELNDKEFETGDLRADMADAMDDLQESMDKVNEIYEENN